MLSCYTQFSEGQGPRRHVQNHLMLQGVQGASPQLAYTSNIPHKVKKKNRQQAGGEGRMNIAQLLNCPIAHFAFLSILLTIPLSL